MLIVTYGFYKVSQAGINVEDIVRKPDIVVPMSLAT